MSRVLLWQLWVGGAVRRMAWSGHPEDRCPQQLMGLCGYLGGAGSVQEEAAAPPVVLVAGLLLEGEQPSVLRGR